MINISKLLCGLSICLLLTSCESPRKQQAKEPVVIKVARNEREPNYTVQEGDTVGSVAQQYDMTRAELIDLNNLTPPYELYSGQKLIVKSSDDSSDSSETDSSSTFSDSSLSNSNISNNNYRFELVQKGGLLTKEDINKTITINSDSSYSSNERENDRVLVEDSSYKTNNEENKASKYVWPVDKSNSKTIKHFKDTKEYTIIQSSSGTPVKAIADGVVKFAGTSHSEGTLGYGKMVIVKHDNPSRLTLYAKLGNTNVTKDQRVRKGQKIGTVAKNNQLYFSLMNVNNKNKRTYINPENVIN